MNQIYLVCWNEEEVEEIVNWIWFWGYQIDEFSVGFDVY